MNKMTTAATTFTAALKQAGWKAVAPVFVDRMVKGAAYETACSCMLYSEAPLEGDAAGNAAWELRLDSAVGAVMVHVPSPTPGCMGAGRTPIDTGATLREALTWHKEWVACLDQ